MGTDKKAPDHRRRTFLVSVVAGGTVGLVLAVLQPVRTWLSTLFTKGHFVSRILSTLVSFFSQPHYVSGLVLLALILFATFGLFALALFLYSLLRPRQVSVTSPELPYVNYTRDQFFGVVWRWQWNYLQVSTLTPFCPYCDYQLSYDDPSTYRLRRSYYDPGVSLICDHCQRTVKKVENYSYIQLLSVVTREIQRKVRLDQYPQPTLPDGDNQ